MSGRRLHLYWFYRARLGVRAGVTRAWLSKEKHSPLVWWPLALPLLEALMWSLIAGALMMWVSGHFSVDHPRLLGVLGVVCWFCILVAICIPVHRTPLPLHRLADHQLTRWLSVSKEKLARTYLERMEKLDPIDLTWRYGWARNGILCCLALWARDKRGWREDEARALSAGSQAARGAAPGRRL